MRTFCSAIVCGLNDAHVPPVQSLDVRAQCVRMRAPVYGCVQNHTYSWYKENSDEHRFLADYVGRDTGAWQQVLDRSHAGAFVRTNACDVRYSPALG